MNKTRHFANILKSLSNAGPAFHECSFDDRDVVRIAWFSNFCQQRKKSNTYTRAHTKVTRVAWHPRCENVWLRDISRRINGAIFLFSGTVLTAPSRPSVRRLPLYTAVCTLFYFIGSALHTHTHARIEPRYSHAAHETHPSCLAT